jgi:hypothetical protein
MTDVLPFPRARESGGRPTALPPGHTAVILLFTGVRYERHGAQEARGAAPDDLGRVDNVATRRRKARRRA